MIKVNGFWWPEQDRHCRATIFDSVKDMMPALALTDRRGVAFQAGGNCGVWAAWLAERFDLVITAEPDATNFSCLRKNVPSNVMSFQCALGSDYGRCDLLGDPKNIGAHHITKGDSIQVLPIDAIVSSLAKSLQRCDYLCLDIEGHEMPALKGASETIRRFKPVIQIEDKGISERYGYKKGDAERWLADEFGYVVRHRIARDVILSC